MKYSNKNKFPRAAGVFSFVAVCVLVTYFVFFTQNPPPAPPPVEEEEIRVEEPPQPPEPEPEEPAPFAFVEAYPVGELVNTDARKAYEDGQMRLYIPTLDFEGPVYAGTDDYTLTRGVGLFDYATLPNKELENANTSIAGHRDIHGKEFYYIDTVLPGDLVYILYNGNCFTYEVEDNFVTHDRDWDPIRIKDYACVTLQSCTPIGTAEKRIFVVGRLVAVDEGEWPFNNNATQ